MSGGVGDFYIGNTTIKFGNVAVLFFGISASLFIVASQLFLRAKEFDVLNFSPQYINKMEDKCKKENKEWKVFEDEQTKNCFANEQIGRKFYNVAIFIMFGGLFFTIVQYNVPIAFLVAGLGFAFEAWQMYR